MEGKGKSPRVKSPRDRSEQREAQEQQLIAQAMLESGYGTTGGRESKRGSVLSHIMGKVCLSSSSFNFKLSFSVY